MFKEQYIRDNEKLHVKEALFMDIQNKLDRENTGAGRRSRFVRWAAVAAAAVLVIGGTLGVVLSGSRTAPADAESPQSVSTQGVSAESVADYDALYELISSAGGAWRGASAGDTGFAVTTDEAVEEETAETPMAAAAAEDNASASAAGSESGGHSGTNVQVAGVDEADIVKTDGEYIYYLVNNTLYIASAAGKDARVLSSTSLESGDNVWRYAEEMFLLGDRLMIISQGWSVVWVARQNGSYESGRDSTQAVIYDVSDPLRPVKLSTLGQSGNYISSRMVGDYVYLVTAQYVYDAVREQPETYVPVVSAGGADSLLSAEDVLVAGDPSENAYTVIGAVNLKSGTEHASAKALFGSAGTVYCSGAHLLVAQSSYTQDVSPIAPDATGKNVQITRSESNTKLVLFSLDEGKIERLAAGSVPGSLLNQFAMDEYEGVIRVVTTVNSWVERIYTDGVDSYEYDDESYNCLYTLDQSLGILGRLENLAEDEWVESVRFDGEIGYFVTFRQTDPLFAVDLGDPAKPKLLGSLKIPGFSEYLHVFGDGLLLGLGYQADEDTGMRQGVKLSMFDVSDKANVTELTTAVLNADYTVVGSNHKAILVDAEKNIIAFPADSSYCIYTYDKAAGFTLVRKVEVGSDLYDGNLRGLFVGRCFYVLSEKGLTVIDMTNWERLSSLNW